MSFASPSAREPSIHAALRGYAVLYHPGEPNHCPGCGGMQWMVGRVMAECANCDTALPIENMRARRAASFSVEAHAWADFSRQPIS